MHSCCLLSWISFTITVVRTTFESSKGSDRESQMSNKKRLLIIGGTGYLGQHLLQCFSDFPKPFDFDLSMAFTHHSSPPPHLLLQYVPHAAHFQVNLQTGQGFDSISHTFGQTDPTVAMSVNVPSSLVKWLSSFTKRETLLIHLSTDQDDETLPVNVYGKSKVAAEEYIIANWSNFAILRSSIIFGPQTISPVSKSLPVQDVVNIIKILSNRWISDGKKLGLVLNVGGPDRISRVQMAEVVARVRGYNTSLIKPIDRGVKSPADISMDISKLIQTLDFTPTSFHEGVKLTINSLT
ncbi:dTDP-4-dehydrorhamnose reductase [Cynara cardunculus var. scolymus]|uniref:dTDP-4-dehydrorhamnose reductase n=1 Tax=Cynara cardunculus var. scolymus TaxID=59895 RepID=A0A103XIA4_CYNCS|nr:dTDP-4-dehydrorhamnose reductase [Cynara cardunculus var. scolymus]